MARREELGRFGLLKLDARRELLELFAMLFVAGIMFADFCPKGGRVVHMVEVGELMNNDVIAERLGDLHEADIE